MPVTMQRADDERADVEDATSREPADVEQRAESVVGVGQLGQELDRIDHQDADDQQRDEECRECGEPEDPTSDRVAAATAGIGAEDECGVDEIGVGAVLTAIEGSPAWG